MKLLTLNVVLAGFAGRSADRQTGRQIGTIELNRLSSSALLKHLVSFPYQCCALLCRAVLDLLEHHMRRTMLLR